MAFQADSFISDEEEEVCPLCVEEMDISDRYFKPCPCGYQICQFCYNNIRQNPQLNGRCPACRRPYDDESIEYKIVSQEEWKKHQVKQNKQERERKQKEREKKEMEQSSRKHLSGMRVIQKNLVYVIGLNPDIPTEDLHNTLRGEQFFGQYGRIQKIVINRRNNVNGTPGLGVYVTFAKKEDAARCIAAVDGSMNDGKYLRAAYGTTKYCSSYLRGQPCPNPNCMFLHEPGEEADSYTRQDLSTIQHAARQGIQKQQRQQHQQRYGDFQHTQQSSLQQPSTPVRHQSGHAPTAVQHNNEDVHGNALPATASWAKPSPTLSSSKLNTTAQSSPAKPTPVEPTFNYPMPDPDPKRQTDFTLPLFKNTLKSLSKNKFDFVFSSAIMKSLGLDSDRNSMPSLFAFSKNNIIDPAKYESTEFSNSQFTPFAIFSSEKYAALPLANDETQSFQQLLKSGPADRVSDQAATPPPGLMGDSHHKQHHSQELLAHLMNGGKKEASSHTCSSELIGFNSSQKVGSHGPSSRSTSPGLSGSSQIPGAPGHAESQQMPVSMKTDAPSSILETTYSSSSGSPEVLTPGKFTAPDVKKIVANIPKTLGVGFEATYQQEHQSAGENLLKAIGPPSEGSDNETHMEELHMEQYGAENEREMIESRPDTPIPDLPEPPRILSSEEILVLSKHEKRKYRNSLKSYEREKKLAVKNCIKEQNTKRSEKPIADDGTEEKLLAVAKNSNDLETGKNSKNVTKETVDSRELKEGENRVKVPSASSNPGLNNEVAEKKDILAKEILEKSKPLTAMENEKVQTSKQDMTDKLGLETEQLEITTTKSFPREKETALFKEATLLHPNTFSVPKAWDQDDSLKNANPTSSMDDHKSNTHTSNARPQSVGQIGGHLADYLASPSPKSTTSPEPESVDNNDKNDKSPKGDNFQTLPTTFGVGDLLRSAISEMDLTKHPLFDVKNPPLFHESNADLFRRCGISMDFLENAISKTTLATQFPSPKDISTQDIEEFISNPSDSLLHLCHQNADSCADDMNFEDSDYDDMGSLPEFATALLKQHSMLINPKWQEVAVRFDDLSQIDDEELSYRQNLAEEVLQLQNQIDKCVARNHHLVFRHTGERLNGDK